MLKHTSALMKNYKWSLPVALLLAWTGCKHVSFMEKPDLYKAVEEVVEEDPYTTKDNGYKTPAERPGYKLVWTDEFTGPELDTSKWSYEVNGSGMGNNELQYYVDSKANVWQRGGYLTFKAIKENYKGMAYTSGRVNSRFKADWKYGRYDIRAKVPIQQGIWPAIWMLPTDLFYGTWPLSGEIDIMESVGHEPKRLFGTLHYGPPWPNNKNTGNAVSVTEGDLFSDFHVYSVEWEESEIRWYLDDVLYSTKTKKDLDPWSWPFDQRFHMILNLAVGGQLPGSPDETTEFPKYMFVDYVRVFQKQVPLN
jgi:beta-glucanase (GH16 family)